MSESTKVPEELSTWEGHQDTVSSEHGPPGGTQGRGRGKAFQSMHKDEAKSNPAAATDQSRGDTSRPLRHESLLQSKMCFQREAIAGSLTPILATVTGAVT